MRLVLTFVSFLFLSLLWALQFKNESYDLKVPAHFGDNYEIPENNPMSEAGIALGRHLFYDKLLSKDTTISCASCHQQAKAFTDGKALSKGFHGRQSKRSTMSLVNLLWTKDFFWDGRVKTLEEQALIPIQDSLEMNLPLEDLVLRLKNTQIYPDLFKKAFGNTEITAEKVAKAIAQFERTLISANSRYDQIVLGKVQATKREQHAIEFFMTHPIPEAGIRGGNCGDCHGSHLLTLGTFHDNGLEKQYKDLGLGNITKIPFDNGKMKAPSLRNIALTAPYMHDGRFSTLEEVLNHYNEHIRESENLDPLIMEASNEVDGETLMLTEAEKADIVFFLTMLTDSSFIKNKKFSNPFE